MTSDIQDWTAFVADIVTVVGLIFVGLQLRAQERATRIQSWAFLSDTSNRRWTHYFLAQGPQEKRFALGELLNFFEIVTSDIVADRLPKVVADHLTPHLVQIIDQMSRNDEVRTEIRAIMTCAEDFSEIRAFALRFRSDFIDYDAVASLFRFVKE